MFFIFSTIEKKVNGLKTRHQKKGFPQGARDTGEQAARRVPGGPWIL